MTLFEIFITVIFGAACTVIGILIWRVLNNTVEALKNLTKDQKKHEEQLLDHDKEIRKHGLELIHSREIANRTEAEFKTLLQQNSDKFDQVIELFSQSLSKTRR